MSANSRIFELEPKGLTELDLFLDVAHLYINGKRYEIRDTGIDQKLADGVHADLIEFVDPETAEKINALLITIEPNKSAPAQHFDSSKVHAAAVDSGSGQWVGINPEGKPVEYNFESESEKQAMVCGPEWTGSWIAGEYGLKIIEIRIC